MLQLQERLDSAMRSKGGEGAPLVGEPITGTKQGVRPPPPKLRLIRSHHRSESSLSRGHLEF